MSELIDRIAYKKSYYFLVRQTDIEIINMKFFVGQNLSYYPKIERVEL